MRNLLQNKLAVGLLLVVAIGMAAYQAQLFSGPSILRVTGREAEAPESNSEGDEQEAPVTNAPPRYLTSLHDWQVMVSTNRIRRDPFQPHDPAPSSSPGSVATAQDGRPAAVSLELQAISQHEDQRLVVIDGKVLREGDEIGGFRVDQIRPPWVSLRGPDGTQRRLEIHFEGTSTAATPAPGDPATIPTNESTDSDAK